MKLLMILFGLVTLLQIDSTAVGGAVTDLFPAMPHDYSIFFYMWVSFLGQLAHVLKKIVAEQQRGEFEFGLWWKHNTASTLLALIVSFVTVFILQETNQLTVTTLFFLGFSGQSLASDNPYNPFKKEKTSKKKE